MPRFSSARKLLVAAAALIALAFAGREAPRHAIPASSYAGTGLLEWLAFGFCRVMPQRGIAETMSRCIAGADPPVFYVDTSDRKVALTFDISWGEKTQALVLPLLRESGQRATFFLSGPWAVRYPEVVAAIVRDGHEIASHGWSHVNLSQQSKESIEENITSAHEALVRVSGREPRFFRPPNGDYDDLVVATARECGYETVIWAVDSLDWKNPGADYMVKRVVSLSFPGAIILCHASDSSRQIHLAIPGILEGLKQEGYDVVTLGELFSCGTPAREDPRGRPKPSPN